MKVQAIAALYPELSSLSEQRVWDSPTFVRLLNLVTRSVRIGDYRPELLRIAERFIEETDRLRALDDVGYLRSRSLGSDIFHYFGRSREARAVIREDGEKVLRKLEKMPPPPKSMTERLELRQECWVAATYIQVEPYRHHDYENALHSLTNCMAVVDQRLVQGPDFPVFGLRAQVCFQLGQVCRAEGLFRKAENQLGAALKFSRLRLESRTAEAKRAGQWDRVEFEHTFANHFTALVLGLGLGWIRYQKGLLRQATPHAESAHILLHGSNDPINQALVLLLLAHIEREEDTPNDPDETIRKIKRVLDVFERGAYRHPVYETRARYALAMTYLSVGNIAEADSQWRRVSQLADEIEDTRWQCNAHLLKSRILMDQNPEQARDAASLALTKAREGGRIRHITCEIEALLLRGAAKYLAKDYRGAKADLTRPKDQHRDHMTKKLQAECSLRLARVAMKTNDYEQADRHLEQWQDLYRDVEFRSVRELGNQVVAERRRSADNFYISKNELSLSYEEHQLLLRKFLLARAQERCNTKEEIARVLGISRQTLHNWNEKKEPEP